MVKALGMALVLLVAVLVSGLYGLIGYGIGFLLDVVLTNTEVNRMILAYIGAAIGFIQFLVVWIVRYLAAVKIKQIDDEINSRFKW